MYATPATRLLTRCLLANLFLIASQAQAASYADPLISEISPVIKAPIVVPPNLFVLLDDSGSMVSPMNYHAHVDYPIPPNPNAYDFGTGQFQQFDEPTAFPDKNGYGYINNDFEDGTVYKHVFDNLSEEEIKTKLAKLAAEVSKYGKERNDLAKQMQLLTDEIKDLPDGPEKTAKIQKVADLQTKLAESLENLAATDSERGVLKTRKNLKKQFTRTDRCRDSEKNKQNCWNFKEFHANRFASLKSALAVAMVEEQSNYSIDFDFLNDFKHDSITLSNMDRSDSSLYEKNMREFLSNLYSTNMSFGAGATPVRREANKLYNNIRQQAKVKDTSNLFLPANAKKYVKSEQLSCKRNYALILSDGEYNNKIFDYNLYGNSSTVNNDFDSMDHNWVFQQSRTDKTTQSVSVNFKGDGSIPEQRLYAGGHEWDFIYYERTGKKDDPSTPEDESKITLVEPKDNTLSIIDTKNTLTDFSFQAWAEDLKPDLEDNVNPSIVEPGVKTLKDNQGNPLADLPEIWNPKNDPADWQRIVTYTVGLGLGTKWTDQYMANVINQKDRYGQPKDFHVWEPYDTAGDFVRAGYVGRGGFTLVNNTENLIELFRRIFKEIQGPNQVNSTNAATASASQITSTSDGIVFNSVTNIGKRSGTLQGHWLYSGINSSSSDRINDAKKCYGLSSGDINNGVFKIPDDAFAGQLCTSEAAQWDAELQMPAWNARTIISYNPTTQSGIDFTYEQMDDNQQTILKSLSEKAVGFDNKPENVVDYLKGNNSLAKKETVRSRADGRGSSKTPLGDFGRGGAHFLGKPNNRIWKKSGLSASENNRAVAFIGSNDGMLHAFDAKTGSELFAYMPSTLYPKFDNLVMPNTNPEAFVDGSISTQDIDEQKTILVAGMGAGGKGLFALDVTNPTAVDKSKVLWEINEKTDKRLGRIFGKPSIIRVESHYKGTLDDDSTAEKERWVVAVGTGYNNTTGGNKDSGILIIDALTGNILDFLHLPGAQGVGEITWIDHQKFQNTASDQGAIYADDNFYGEMDRGYVGDLKGNVWIIDLAYDSDLGFITQLRSGLYQGSNNNPSKRNNPLSTLNDHGITNPKPFDKLISSDKPAPLFIATDEAGNRQPITSKITVLNHPTNRGYMLYFGTGDLFNVAPLEDNIKNSMYGIWDDVSDNYGDVSTKKLINNNQSRDRFYLTYYPWSTLETTFANGGKAFSRVLNNEVNTIKINWANFAGAENSSAKLPGVAGTDTEQAANRSSAASGWVVNTGRNDAMRQYERVFQAPYSVVNEDKQEGLTFLMHTLSTSDDPCLDNATSRTWSMTFRTDSVDGPFAELTSSVVDLNQDGIIDKNDKVKDTSVTSDQGEVLTIVPIGAVSEAGGGDINGKSQIEYSPTTVQSESNGGSGAGSFCAGTSRSYKRTLGSVESGGSVLEEVNICIPKSLSSWSEIE